MRALFVHSTIVCACVHGVCTCNSQSYCERISIRSQPWIFLAAKKEKKKMADRENNVYLAKLAEQAERYDGKSAKIMSSRPALTLAKV